MNRARQLKVKLQQEEAAKREAEERRLAEAEALQEQQLREQQRNLTAFGKNISIAFDLLSLKTCSNCHYV